MNPEAWTTEPVLHSHVTDGLPDDDPRSMEVVACLQCGQMVHCMPNECMTAWADTEDGPMCLDCLRKALP